MQEIKAHFTLQHALEGIRIKLTKEQEADPATTLKALLASLLIDELTVRQFTPQTPKTEFELIFTDEKSCVITGLGPESSQIRYSYSPVSRPAPQAQEYLTQIISINGGTVYLFKPNPKTK